MERAGTTKVGNVMSVIRYVCVREAHLRQRADFALVIHNGELAFCHEPRPRRDHKWMATEGVKLADLRNSTVARELAIR